MLPARGAGCRAHTLLWHLKITESRAGRCLMLFPHLIYRPGKRTPISVSKYFSDMVPFVRHVMCVERSGPCVHVSCSCKHFLKANCTRRKFGGCRDPRSRLSGTFSHAGLEGGERRITQGFLGAFSFFSSPSSSSLPNTRTETPTDTQRQVSET